jgi:hypothetical protein
MALFKKIRHEEKFVLLWIEFRNSIIMKTYSYPDSLSKLKEHQMKLTTKTLTKLRLLLKYTESGASIIGRSEGFWFSISHADEGRPITVRTSLSGLDERREELKSFLDLIRERYYFRSSEIKGSDLTIELFQKLGPDKSSTLTGELIAELTNEFNALGLRSACGFCGLEGSFNAVRSGSDVAEACPSCMSKLETEIGATSKNSQNGSYLRGALGASIASVITGIAWSIATAIGAFSALFGFAFALVAKKGYLLFKGKKAAHMPFIIAGAAFLGLVVAMIGDLSLANVSPDDIYTLEDVTSNMMIGFAFSLIGTYATMSTTIRELGMSSTKLETVYGEEGPQD